ncbi:RNA methyltransferase [Candidatus Bathyarchaeota archaeon]|nr:RNA methyltransferase [Candidatus Bathyarchaeota archaeon]
MDPLTNLRVVLVEPANTGNIGAAARVLKNTGISQLVLVNPTDKWDPLRTRWLAHASGEILDSCQIFPDLASAVADTHLVIGTTHRTGRGREVISTPRELIPQIAPLAFHHRIALVFGREKDGLWREELIHCHHLVRFPSAVLYPSFNLSHAVLLLTYEFFQALQEAEPAPPQPLATAEERERLLNHLFGALDIIDFKPHNDDPANFSRVVRRFFNKIQLDKRDIRVIHRVLGQIRKFASRFPHSSSSD